MADDNNKQFTGWADHQLEVVPDALGWGVSAAPPASDPTYMSNQRYLLPGIDASTNFNTKLSPQEESAFRQWVTANKVPFDVDATGPTDYDMRGFYRGLTSGDPHAQQSINANDNRMHYSDYWKTPYHKSFSAESQWADPKTAPRWNDQDQLVTPDGRVIFDERNQNKPAVPYISDTSQNVAVPAQQDDAENREFWEYIRQHYNGAPPAENGYAQSPMRRIADTRRAPKGREGANPGPYYRHDFEAAPDFWAERRRMYKGAPPDYVTQYRPYPDIGYPLWTGSRPPLLGLPGSDDYSFTPKGSYQPYDNPPITDAPVGSSTDALYGDVEDMVNRWRRFGRR